MSKMWWFGVVIGSLTLLTYTYIFLCRVAHKANSFFLHLVRSSAAASASSDDMSMSLRSREMVWLQVVRGLPRPLLPAASSSRPAVVASPLSCGSDVRTRSLKVTGNSTNR